MDTCNNTDGCPKHAEGREPATTERGLLYLEFRTGTPVGTQVRMCPRLGEGKWQESGRQEFPGMSETFSTVFWVVTPIYAIVKIHQTQHQICAFSCVFKKSEVNGEKKKEFKSPLHDVAVKYA